MSLQLNKVALSINSRTLLQEVTLSIEPGTVSSLMGASGSGKSTLLDYIIGTQSHHVQASGDVILDGRHIHQIPTEKRKVGILFQDALLFPHLTVGENLGFGLAASLTREQRCERIQQALDSANLSGAYRKDPATLSGGERNRIALMRTLLAEPEALLLDEPFSRLDDMMKQSFREFVFTRAIERQIPVLMVTHDIQDTIVANELSGGPVYVVENKNIQLKTNTL
jgi:putative thiamine transport system ATP-binding protein